MRRCPLALVLAATTAASAATVAKTPTQYLITRPKKPVTVDGKLGEWDMAASPYVIDPTSKSPLSSVHSNDPTNPPKGKADLSGRAALAWDDEYLFVAGQMTDDHLRGVRPDSVGNQGPAGWKCDSLMVRVHSFRQPMKTNSPYSKSPFLALRYAPPQAARGQLLEQTARRELDRCDSYWKLTQGSRWAVTETPNGYQVEAAIPWADLGFDARPGERLFMAFLAADTDPGEALNQVGWGFRDEIRDCPIFRLVDRADAAGCLTLSADSVPTDKPWAIRAELDALNAPARLEAIRIKDAIGQAVLTAPLGLDVPKGMTGSLVHELKAGAVPKPGQYSVELVARCGKEQVVVAREPLRVVEPQPEPPTIQNLPGEIRHMSPDRVAHNAYGQHRRGFFKHGFVQGRQGYVPFIRRWVEPNLKARARQAVKAKSKWAAREAFHCMALHRITGDAEYATLAADLMGVLLDYQLEHGTGWHQFTKTTIYRYLTWLQDPASPLAPKNAETRYRQMLHKVAAKPSSGLFNESGTHNRVWHRYALQKAARDVAEADGKPIDPRIIEYTDFHDKLIGTLGDTDDNSAGYHWVFFDAAASIYFHTGDWDAFVKHKGYRQTLARYVEMVSPSGACVPFGSTSGWPTLGHSMWVYEWMSRLTRDGRFRWTSHRIAEYATNHLDHHANQYHGPFDRLRDNFVLAYLFADDSVAPKPAPGHSRVTWRHPHPKASLEQRRARPGLARRVLDGSRWIPDKLVLATDSKPQSLWGLVELVPVGGHCGSLPGNLIALVAHDSALLAGQGYYELTPDFNNLLWIEDLDGMAADPRPTTTQVPLFVEDRAFTFARIVTTAFQQLPVTTTRDILFYKDGFVVVHDRAKFESTMRVRLGPCWQTRCLGPQCGEGWFNTYFDQLYHTGLGLGRGIQAMENPNWDLLVYFAPRPGRRHTVHDRFLDNVWRNAPVRLRQEWAGIARAGQEISFTTVLLPHVPTITPRHLLEPPPGSDDRPRIELVRDDDQLTVVKVTSETDPQHKFRSDTWLMLNRTGKLASAGPLASDGLVAVVGHDHRDRIRHRVVVGGNVLKYGGTDESAAARKLEAAPLKMPAELKP